MLTLNCTIEIGKYVFYNVQSVSIELGRRQQIGRAKIILARRYRSKNIQEAILEGDQVNIKLGYNGNFYKEFSGYVVSIGANTPVTIECEDAMYQLKRTAVAPISWKSVKLADVLKHVAPDAVIEVQDIKLEPYYIRGQITAAKVIESLKDQYGLDAYYRQDGKLYVGLAFAESKSVAAEKVLYDTGCNVINKNLQYQRAESTRIKLKMISLQKNGTKITYEAGDPDGEIRTLHEYNLTLPELKSLADERLKLFKVTGLKGSIETFGEPYIDHGMIASIADPYQPEYDGNYLVDAVQTTFGMNGYRREVTLGKKAS